MPLSFSRLAYSQGYHVDINNGKKLEIPVYGFIRKASIANFVNILFLVRKTLEARAPRLSDVVTTRVSYLIR
jgi:hypothetical protein